MGTQRSLRRVGRSPKIAMSDTNIVINGCRIFSGHPDPNRAHAVGKVFGKMLGKMVSRSRCVNVNDLYKESVSMRSRLLDGGGICN